MDLSDLCNRKSYNPLNPGVKIYGKSKYILKDRHKSNHANKMIGLGAKGSSTYAYAKSWSEHNLLNVGSYTSNDIVFISVNGNRPDRIPFLESEVKLAIDAKAILLTDNDRYRKNGYNIGEMELAEFISKHNYQYVDTELMGVWLSLN